MGIFSIFSRKSRGLPKDEETERTENSGGMYEVSVVEEAAQAAEVYNNDEEIIAVITAAIAAGMRRPVSGFRVVSFKKRGNW